MTGSRWPLGGGDLYVMLLSIVAGTSLVAVLDGYRLFTGAVAGVAVAAGTLLLQQRFKLLLLEWAASSILAFVIVGGPITGSLPTPSAYRMFLHGVIGGWADLLSSVPPVTAIGDMAALPYALSWMAAMIGFVLVRHVRFPVVAAVGPVAVFGIGLLFSVELRTTSLVQGAALAALTLALGWHQQRNLGFEVDEEIGNTTIARRRSRILWASMVLVATSLAAPIIAPSAPGMADRERFDLRHLLEPPWNPLDEPSPLAQISSNYLEAARDDVVFVVRGNSIPRRWSLATLASYDGTVWTVGDVDVDGAAEFIPLDHQTPEGAVGTAEASTEQTLEVEMRDVEFPWLPLTGKPLAIDPDGDSITDVRYNPRTRTAAVPTGSANVTFRLETELPTLPSEPALSEATYPVGNPEQTVAAVRNWTADIVEGADAGWPQVTAIRDALRGGGYLSDERNNPGHSWARLTEFFDQEAFYGNEEQYGAVAAIAARNSGLKSRVTVGYLIDAEKLDATEIAVTKDEATAWLEVLTDEYGWVQVDVTPSRDNEPTIAEAGTTTRDVAAPNPPPPPPPPPAAPRQTDQAATDDEDDEEEESEAEGFAIPTIALVAGATVSLPLVLAGLWLAGFGLIKARRRTRRRMAQDPNERATGAWLELMDRLAEVDRVGALNPSVIEQAGLFEETIPAAFGTLEVARLVDRSAFGPGVGDAEAAEAWNRCDAIVHQVSRSASRATRVARLADPRPVLTGAASGGGR